MTEELKPLEGEKPVDKAPEVPQLTEIEKRAVEMGWRPLDEFNGDEDDFIDAKEFVRRKPLFDKIEGQSKEIKSVRKALEALKTHYTKVQETEYNRALTTLKEKRQEAISNADGVTFDQIDTQIKEVESAMAVVKDTQNRPLVEDPPVVHPEFVAWQNKNQWYSAYKYMRSWADDHGTELAKQGLTPSEVLRRVEADVKKEFPDKFVNPNKAGAPSVEGNTNSRGTRAGKDTFELSEVETSIMNTLIRSDPKTFTREKYIAELKAAKGIK